MHLLLVYPGELSAPTRLTDHLAVHALLVLGLDPPRQAIPDTPNTPNHPNGRVIVVVFRLALPQSPWDSRPPPDPPLIHVHLGPLPVERPQQVEQTIGFFVRHVVWNAWRSQGILSIYRQSDKGSGAEIGAAVNGLHLVL